MVTGIRNAGGSILFPSPSGSSTSSNKSRTPKTGRDLCSGDQTGAGPLCERQESTCSNVGWNHMDNGMDRVAIISQKQDNPVV